MAVRSKVRAKWGWAATFDSLVHAVRLALIANLASLRLTINHILLKENAPHSAATHVGCTVLQEPDNVVHTGLLELLIHLGGYVT